MQMVGYVPQGQGQGRSKRVLQKTKGASGHITQDTLGKHDEDPGSIKVSLLGRQVSKA